MAPYRTPDNPVTRFRVGDKVTLELPNSDLRPPAVRWMYHAHNLRTSTVIRVTRDSDDPENPNRDEIHLDHCPVEGLNWTITYGRWLRLAPTEA